MIELVQKEQSQQEKGQCFSSLAGSLLGRIKTKFIDFSGQAKFGDPLDEMDRGSGGNSNEPGKSQERSRIFGALLDRRKSIRNIIDRWFSDYKRNRRDAMRELIQFFFQSAGCRSEITREYELGNEAFSVVKQVVISSPFD